MECNDNICEETQYCVNNEGSYQCYCQTGWKLIDYACHDVNECLTGIASCHEKAKCLNVEGSYECTCESGYRGNGNYCENIVKVIQ